MQRLFTSFFVSLLFSLGLRAQTPDYIVQLWPDGAPTDNGVTGPEVDYGDHVTNISVPELLIWVPEKCEGVAVVATPGGSYFDVWYQHEGKDWAKWYNDQGITYAVLKYRLPREEHREVPLDDARRAMHILRARAEEWGNYKKIGIQGCSAGGHLAASLSTMYQDAEERPDFSILFYPVISMDSSITHAFSLQNLLGKNPSEELVKQYSCENRVTKDTPPAFILASTDDDVVPVQNSLEYYRALVANGVSATMHLYPVGGHGWAWKDTFPYHEQYKAEMKQWLKLTLQLP